MVAQEPEARDRSALWLVVAGLLLLALVVAQGLTAGRERSEPASPAFGTAATAGSAADPSATAGSAAAAPGAPGPCPRVAMDQVDCVSRPRVQVAVEGQSVSIRNTDRTLHNVHAYNVKPPFNRAQPPKSPPIEKVFAIDQPVVKLKCDVHPWMV